MTVPLVGTQLGDEGKGGIVDLYADDADVVARYQGGDNAGHTVVVDGDEFKLSLVPSGAVRGRVGVLGNGCVVNPRTLFDELDALRERGLDPDVKVAQRAHVILPYHRELDGIEEAAKSDSALDAGTTGRGIGPTYEDKAGRRGIRIGDLLDPDTLRDRLEYVVPLKRALAEDVFGVETGEAFDVDAIYEPPLRRAARRGGDGRHQRRWPNGRRPGITCCSRAPRAPPSTSTTASTRTSPRRIRPPATLQRAPASDRPWLGRARSSAS